MTRRIVDWLEHRTGVETAIKHFLYEDVPASSGWHQVFGSVALFLFLIQAFTGILLAFNFAATPGESYRSVKYIVTELTGGRMIRGLHHWGASMMIVTVVLHMIQVFLYGAYKKPREATWSVGVVLLLLTFAYGLTGYLLPWDNRAYWGTVVATKIAASAPFAGDYVTRLMGAEDGVGVVTFARFYALHVLLLPPATMLLIGIHIYLVRRHGVAPAPDDNLPKKKFFPGQVFKDTVAIFVTFCILFAMAVMVRVPLEHIADPTDTSYIPRPDWYFLFLFQTLKYFEGPLEVVGSVILPTLAVVALFLVPFIDRGKAKKVAQRGVAMAAAALALLGWTGLTVAAIKSTPPSTSIDVTNRPEVKEWQHLAPEQLASVGYFRKDACASCHVGATKVGPAIVQASSKPTEWLVAHFTTPPASQRTSQLTDAQRTQLATFVQKLDPRSVEAINVAPTLPVEGAMLYQQFRCGFCHKVNGVGQNLGPVLNGTVERRTRDWIIEHFHNPQKLSPGTTMPPYKLNPKDMERMVSYIEAMPIELEE